jgi:hypothetical protein
MDRDVLLGQLAARRHRIDRPLIGKNIPVGADHGREFSDLGEGATDFLSEAAPRTAEVGGWVLTGTGAVFELDTIDMFGQREVAGVEFPTLACECA